MNLKIETRVTDGVTIVSCHGRIMFGEEATELRDTLKRLLSSTRQIVINLSGVTYIDSGGLGTLVGVYSSARGAGADHRDLVLEVGEVAVGQVGHDVADRGRGEVEPARLEERPGGHRAARVHVNADDFLQDRPATDIQGLHWPPKEGSTRVNQVLSH